MRAGSIAIGSIAIGVGFLILSLLFIHQASLLPGPLAEDEVGPARFPYILGGIGAALAVILIVQEWLRRTRAKGEAEAFSWRSLAMIGLCVAYVVAIAWIGYYVATVVWLCAAVACLGGRWLAPVTAAAFAAFVYVVFELTLGVPLP